MLEKFNSLAISFMLILLVFNRCSTSFITYAPMIADAVLQLTSLHTADKYFGDT